MHLADRVTTDTAPAHKQQVKCGGNCLELNAKAATDGAALLAKVQEHLQAQRYASLEMMLERRLDVAIELLRRHEAKKPPSEAYLALARVVDSRLQHPADDGWLTRLQGRDGGALRHAEETLVKGEELVHDQKWAKACDYLEKYQQNFGAYPYHAIQAGLLLSESQRRLGRPEDASQTWQRTVVITARLAPRWSAPGFWEQLSAQRILTTTWPADVATAFAPLLPARLRSLTANPAFAPEALVWFAIGNARLQRSEGPAALTAFKHADSHGQFADWDDFLCLYQAKALLAMEQAAAGVGMLTALVGRTDSPWHLPALAVLGSSKLQANQPQQAIAFLKQAVETSRDDFLFRPEAEADLGLAYLSLGDATNGLARLRAAQERFHAEGRVEMLLTCQENEAAYQDQAGHSELAREIRMRSQDTQKSFAFQSGNQSITPTGHLTEHP
jgi:tetratricopeptide (TPR) repeat protein